MFSVFHEFSIWHHALGASGVATLPMGATIDFLAFGFAGWTGCQRVAGRHSWPNVGQVGPRPRSSVTTSSMGELFVSHSAPALFRVFDSFSERFLTLIFSSDCAQSGGNEGKESRTPSR